MTFEVRDRIRPRRLLRSQPRLVDGAQVKGAVVDATYSYADFHLESLRAGCQRRAKSTPPRSALRTLPLWPGTGQTRVPEEPFGTRSSTGLGDCQRRNRQPVQTIGTGATIANVVGYLAPTGGRRFSRCGCERPVQSHAVRGDLRPAVPRTRIGDRGKPRRTGVDGGSRSMTRDAGGPGDAVGVVSDGCCLVRCLTAG